MIRTKRKSFESYPSQAQNEYDNLIDNTQKYSDRDIDQDIEKEHPQLINVRNLKIRYQMQWTWNKLLIKFNISVKQLFFCLDSKKFL